MTQTIHKLIQSLGVAALLAAATFSIPAGAIHAKETAPPYGPDYGVKSCSLNGKTYPSSTTFTTNGKEYHCDGYTGQWIIFIDEDRVTVRPPHFQLPIAPRSGAALAQP